MSLGKTIRKYRNKLGLTQAELAVKVNKSESTVRMWELEKSQPDNSTLVLLSNIFDVTTDYLLGNDRVYGVGHAIAARRSDRWR